MVRTIPVASRALISLADMIDMHVRIRSVPVSERDASQRGIDSGKIRKIVLSHSRQIWFHVPSPCVAGGIFYAGIEIAAGKRHRFAHLHCRCSDPKRHGQRRQDFELSNGQWRVRSSVRNHRRTRTFFADRNNRERICSPCMQAAARQIALSCCAPALFGEKVGAQLVPRNARNALDLEDAAKRYLYPIARSPEA
jgi:hypothetical protein